MENDKQVIRDECFRVFGGYGFERTKKLDKSDEYKSKVCGETLYFFWKQGGRSELNISIDPNFDYSQLLQLAGVRIKKTKGKEGIRFGTSMSAFPSKYEGHIPGDSQSKVGRMFSIVLPDGNVDRFQPLKKFVAILSGVGSKNAVPLPPPKDSLIANESEQAVDEDIDTAGKLDYPIEDIQQRAIKTRRGQPDFRKRVFDAYGNKCTVTGCEVQSVLEAAHIIPHAEGTDYEVGNGLPLRADIHTLFDLRMLAVSSDYRIHISRELADSEYGKLHGLTIRLPSIKLNYPSPEKLAKHFESFKERNAILQRKIP